MKKVFTILVVLLISVLLLEAVSWLALRSMTSQPDPIRSETHLFDAHRNHRLNPAFQFSGDSKSRIHSPDGFRQDNAVAIIKPENTVRIIVLGTSALYGAGAAAPYPTHRPLYNDETITYFLEQELRDRLKQDGRHYSVEIINAGTSATKTFHHLLRLNDSLLEYSPDIVVNLDGHNDFYVDKIGDRWNGYSYSTTILVDEFIGRTAYLPLFTGVRMLAPYSNFFNLVEKALKRIWYTTKVHGNPLPNTPHYDFGIINDHGRDIGEAARRSYIRDLWQIQSLGQYAGYDHAVLLQPEVVFEKSALLSESDRHIQELTVELQGNDSVELMKDVREQLPALFQGADIPYYDLGELASVETSDSQLYTDYCHLTPQGSAVLASKMAEILYPMVTSRIAQNAGHRQVTSQ